MTKKLFILSILLLQSTPAFAQCVDTAWVKLYNGSGNYLDEAYAIAVDSSGNVYVTGKSYGDNWTYEDYATIKYYPNGDSVWARRYNGPGDITDKACAIAIDDSGNVYVTGYSWGGLSGDDYATIKYYPKGNTAWVKRYNGPGNGHDEACAIAVDEYGNVYVTGGSWGGGSSNDYATIKYYPNGDTVWLRRYNGPGNGHDGASAIAVDGFGNIYVTGASEGIGANYDYATIKYYPNGDTAWVRRYNGPGYDYDYAHAMTIDGSGNIYVAGQSIGTGTQHDYTTIKYDSSGNELWVRRYNGPGNSNDQIYAMAMDGSGSVYVTGQSYGVGSGYDYATIKYYPNGDTAWVRRYTGPAYDYDCASAITIDGSGNAYVTGQSIGTGTQHDYATIKYDSSGNEFWIRRYNGPGGSYDYARAITVDGRGNVYVTGGTYGSVLYLDYATIKYCQSLLGDANGDGVIDIGDVVYLINYLFRFGDPPCPSEAGDINCDEVIDIGDVVYLINYLFKDGPPPSQS
jgi:hypothetical protein